LLRRDLTKQNADLETHRCRGYVANFPVAVFRSKKRERRRATLENPKSPSLKKSMWILRTNLRPVSPTGPAFRTKRGKRFTGMTSDDSLETYILSTNHY
jgi:hypothetical protein